jgi:hypothetical protein
MGYSDERQLNGEGQISHYNDREVPYLRVHTESAVGKIVKENTNILLISSNFLLSD